MVLKITDIRRIAISPITVTYSYEINNTIFFLNKVTFDLNFFSEYIYRALFNMNISDWITRKDIEFLLYRFLLRNIKYIKGDIPENILTLNQMSYYEVVDRISEVGPFFVGYKSELRVLKLSKKLAL